MYYAARTDYQPALRVMPQTGFAHPLLASAGIPDISPDSREGREQRAWVDNFVNFCTATSYGAQPLPENSSMLQAWFQRQLHYKSMGTLPAWRKQLLQKLGLCADTDKDMGFQTVPVGKQRLSQRRQEVKKRTDAFKAFGLEPVRFTMQPGLDADTAVWALLLQRIVKRAIHFSQALRVLWTPTMLSQPREWWLYGVEQANVATRLNSFHLVVRNHGRSVDTVDESISAEVTELLKSGYSENGNHYELKFACSDGSVLAIDYDVYLADQSHEGQAFFDGADTDLDAVALPMDWDAWLASPSSPGRLTTAESTSSKAFNQHYQQLKARLLADRHTPIKPRDADREVYRFIEHMVQKLQLGQLSHSHRDRLALLDFQWGRERKSSRTIFTGNP